MKDERLYAKFTLDFPDNPKIMCLSTPAKWALVELTIYSRRHLTDGFISKPIALAKHGAEVCLELATNDAEKPSLIEVENGYFIHDFEAHQSTKVEIEELTRKRKLAGQKGGQARAKQVLKQNASKSKPETETETYIKTNQKDASSDARETPKQRSERLFEEWWVHYPKKKAKGQARTAYVRALKKISHESLVAAVLARPEELQKEERFIPNPASWLNGERWLDGTSNGSTNADDLIKAALATGELNPIIERTRLRYEPPDPPEDIPPLQLKTWQTEQRKQWVKANEQSIREQL